MNDNWLSMYQNNNQFQNMNNIPYNQMNNNPMYMNMNFAPNNSPEQIQMMANFFARNRQDLMNQNMNNNFNMNMNNNNNNNNNQNMNNIFNRKMSYNNNNQNIRMNVNFKTMDGIKIMMNFDINNTVNEILTKFLKRCNLEEYIDRTEGLFTFIFSGQQLHFADNTRLGDICSPNAATTMIILVLDTNHLIGA